jgi:hypothetical protein
MSSLCPFFKETCHGNQCVMWRDESGLIVGIIGRILASYPDETSQEEAIIEERYNNDNPDGLENVNAEFLATELIDYAKKEMPHEDIQSVIQFFWQSKGIHRFISPEIDAKIQRANHLAIKQKLDAEKGEIPTLVSQLVDWARIKEYKRLTLADVDAFLFEKELTIMHETKRVLYSMANVKLKTGK